MKKIAYKIITLIMLGSFFAFAGTGASKAQVLAQAVGPCLDNRSIAAAVASGQFLSLPQLAQLAGFNPQQTHNLRVCQINGQPYYYFDTFDAYGQTRTYVLRATDGAPYIGG
jgi:hypothetical protein